MKAFILAATALALVAASVSAPASAQMGGGGGSSPHANPPEKPKPDEKAYKAALDRIPDAKAKYDPWGTVAPAQAPVKKKK